MKDFTGKKVLILGDSIMNGSGNNDFGVGEYLAKDLGFSLAKYCVGGARVGYDEGKSWVVDQVKSAIENFEQPDLIVFNGFTNDCNMTDGKNCDVDFGDICGGCADIYSLTESMTFSECFEGIAVALKKYFKGSKLVFVRPHRMGRRDEKAQIMYGERAVEICKKYGISVADIYTDSVLDTFDPVQRDKYTADSYGWGRGDCTHPNAVCYEQIYMPLIEKAIDKLFREEVK